MKIFISWSDERSEAVAKALYAWIPKVLEYAEPFMSQISIRAGTLPIGEIFSQLSSAEFAIACMTPENANSAWIAFEAAAIGKKIGDLRVVPYLYDFGSIADFPSGPIKLFQGKLALSQTLEVLQSINECAPEGFKKPTVRVAELHAAFWPYLEKELSAIPAPLWEHDPTPGGFDTWLHSKFGKSSLDQVRGFINRFYLMRVGMITFMEYISTSLQVNWKDRWDKSHTLLFPKSDVDRTFERTCRLIAGRIMDQWAQIEADQKAASSTGQPATDAEPNRQLPS